MRALLNTAIPPQLNWKTDVFRNSRSIDYKNRYTEFTFGYEADRVDYLSLSGNDEETRQDLRWISYRQHFFSAILIPESPISEAKLISEDRSRRRGPGRTFYKDFYYQLQTQLWRRTEYKFKILLWSYRLPSTQRIRRRSRSFDSHGMGNFWLD